METALDHLDAALAAMMSGRDALRQQLGDADRQIKILERTVAELRGVGPTPEAAEGPSIRDIARLVAGRGGVFALSEVVEAVHSSGNDAKYGSISSILSRMVSEGELEKGEKRGTFVIMGEDSPEATGSDKPSGAPTEDSSAGLQLPETAHASAYEDSGASFPEVSEG